MKEDSKAWIGLIGIISLVAIVMTAVGLWAGVSLANRLHGGLIK